MFNVRHKALGVFGVCAIGALSLPSVSSVASAASMPTVKVAFTTASAGEAPFYAAVDQGFYKKFGLNVQNVAVKDSTVAEAALASGSVELAGAGDVLELTQKTGDLYVGIVGTNQQAAYFNVVCNSQIPKPTPGESGKAKLKELIGKKIAFSGIGSTPYLTMQEALAFNGFNIKQVQVVNLATGTPQYSALESSQVACVVGNANVVATQSGGSWKGFKLLTFSDPGVSSQDFLKYNSGVDAKSSWLSSHKSEAAAFAKGFTAAVEWMQEPKNLAGAEKAVREAEGPAVAKGKELTTLMKALLPSINPVWGPATVKADYAADLATGVIKKIPNFKPSQYIGPGSPATPAAAKKIAKQAGA